MGYSFTIRATLLHLDDELKMYRNFCQIAEDQIRQCGGKTTTSRIGILSVLLSAQQAMTHREIEQCLLETLPLDRVTLYRGLEWLVSQQLIHKVVSGDRVWRYHANGKAHSHQHAHFKCTGCSQVICLDDLPLERQWPLPTGYQLQEVELTVKGLCADCS